MIHFLPLEFFVYIRAWAVVCCGRALELVTSNGRQAPSGERTSDCTTVPSVQARAPARAADVTRSHLEFIGLESLRVWYQAPHCLVAKVDGVMS